MTLVSFEGIAPLSLSSMLIPIRLQAEVETVSQGVSGGHVDSSSEGREVDVSSSSVAG